MTQPVGVRRTSGIRGSTFVRMTERWEALGLEPDVALAQAYYEQASMEKRVERAERRNSYWSQVPTPRPVIDLDKMTRDAVMELASQIKRLTSYTPWNGSLAPFVRLSSKEIKRLKSENTPIILAMRKSGKEYKEISREVGMSPQVCGAIVAKQSAKKAAEG